MNNHGTAATQVVSMGIKLVGSPPEVNHLTSSHNPFFCFLLARSNLTVEPLFHFVHRFYLRSNIKNNNAGGI